MIPLSIVVILLAALLGEVIPVTLSKEKSTEDSAKKKLGDLTFEHFSKVRNDDEMGKVLKANLQDPLLFKGLSRQTICNRMRVKAINVGHEYLKWYP